MNLESYATSLGCFRIVLDPLLRQIQPNLDERHASDLVDPASGDRSRSTPNGAATVTIRSPSGW